MDSRRRSPQRLGLRSPSIGLAPFFTLMVFGVFAQATRLALPSIALDEQGQAVLVGAIYSGWLRRGIVLATLTVLHA